MNTLLDRKRNRVDTSGASRLFKNYIAIPNRARLIMSVFLAIALCMYALCAHDADGGSSNMQDTGFAAVFHPGRDNRGMISVKRSYGDLQVMFGSGDRVEAFVSGVAELQTYEIYDRTDRLVTQSSNEASVCRIFFSSRSLRFPAISSWDVYKELVMYMRDRDNGSLEVGIHVKQKECDVTVFQPVTTRRIRTCEVEATRYALLMVRCQYAIRKDEVIQSAWYRLTDKTPTDEAEKQLGIVHTERALLCEARGAQGFEVGLDYACAHGRGDGDVEVSGLRLIINTPWLAGPGNYSCEITTEGGYREEYVVSFNISPIRGIFEHGNGLVCAVAPPRDPETKITLTLPRSKCEELYSSWTKKVDNELWYGFDVANPPSGEYTCTARFYNRSVTYTVYVETGKGTGTGAEVVITRMICAALVLFVAAFMMLVSMCLAAYKKIK